MYYVRYKQNRRSDVYSTLDNVHSHTHIHNMHQYQATYLMSESTQQPDADYRGRQYIWLAAYCR